MRCLPEGFCQCFRPADIKKLQSLLLLLRRDQEVSIVPVEHIAVGKKGQLQLYILDRRPPVLEVVDGLAIPDDPLA